MAKENFIYKFDVTSLLYGEMYKDYIKCGPTVSEDAREVVVKGDSLLFDQLKTRFKGKGLEELICILDFSSFVENKNKIDEVLSQFDNGFLISINLLDEDGNETNKTKEIRFKSFLKSNSMSKDCQIYYLNADKEIFEKMQEVSYFGFEKTNQKIELSKLYAYSGTLCSDVTLVDIKFKPGEFVVIKDKEIENHIMPECITAISYESLCGHLSSIKEIEGSVDILKLNSYADEIETIDKKSKVYNFLSDYKKCRDNNFANLKELKGKYGDTGKNSSKNIEWKQIRVKNYPINVNMFDGEGLISFELRDEILKKADYEDGDWPTSLQIRMCYVKGMVHTCNFKKFFKDNNVSTIKGIDGKLYDIEKVKIILTESMFKCKKFIKNLGISDYISWYINTINEYKYKFGFSKRDPKEKDLVKLQYEYISTLPLSENDIDELVNKHRNYINDSCVDEEDIVNNLNAKQNGIYDIYKLSDKGKEFILKTKAFTNGRDSIFKSLKEDSKFCRFKVKGTQKYLSGDLLELLYYCANIKFPKEHTLPYNKYYMPTNLEDFEGQAVILRSPHYSRNEIAMAVKDDSDKLRKEYFGHLTNIAMVNPLSGLPNRVSGADYDGDLVIIVRETMIVKAVKEEIVGKYPIAIIPSLEPWKCEYSYKNNLICCRNTFSSQVGFISNIALKDALIQYDPRNGQPDYDKIAFYTILNGLEIDSAKNGKKPKLPTSKKKGENDKDILDYFFEAKKEYMGKSYGGNSKKELIKKLKEDKTTTNNILRCFESSNKIQRCYKAEAKTNFECKLVTKEHVEILALQHLYAKTNSMISKALSKKGKKYNSSKAVASLILMDEILNNQEICAEDLVDCIQDKFTSYEAYEKLCEYVNGNNNKDESENVNFINNRYHFLKTESEKLDYIEELGINVPQTMKDVLVKQNNENYRLLYLALLCASKRLNHIHIYDEVEEKLPSDLKNNSELFSHYQNFYKENKDELENYINDNINSDVDDLKEAILSKFKEKCKKYNDFKTISETIDIYKSNLIFTVFFEQLKEYLEQGI